MKNKIRSLLLASTFLLGLSACSDDESISSSSAGTAAGDGGAESAQYAGTYDGTMNVSYTGEDLTGDDFRGEDAFPATVVINTNGTVTLKMEGESINGTINGNSMEVAMKITKSEDGINCEGDALVKATVSGNRLQGPVSGDAECKLGLIKRDAELTGTISATKR